MMVTMAASFVAAWVSQETRGRDLTAVRGRRAVAHPQVTDPPPQPASARCRDAAAYQAE
jgi:hypothetical protein